MYKFIHRYLRNYTIRLLLSIAQIALGSQELSAAGATTHALDTSPKVNSATTPQPATSLTLEAPEALTLTAEQQQCLHAYLNEKDSAQKRFKKLLAVIGHEEAYVREAAFRTAYSLLIDQPTLAHKSAVESLTKVILRVKNAAQAKQTLQLLVYVVETNPQLALPAAKAVIKLTKGKVAQKGRTL